MTGSAVKLYFVQTIKRSVMSTVVPELKIFGIFFIQKLLNLRWVVPYFGWVVKFYLKKGKSAGHCVTFLITPCIQIIFKILICLVPMTLGNGISHINLFFFVQYHITKSYAVNQVLQAYCYES